MNRVKTLPASREEWLALRAKDITSTEMAALFHASPYATEFELYHRHVDGTVTEIESNERMTWGNRLQDAIAEGIGEDQGWKVIKMEEYMSLPDHRIGASFDYRIVVGDEPGEGDGILEIKNVDSLIFRDGWIVDEEGGIEAPTHIEIQLQTQLLVSGLKWGVIGALVGGNRMIYMRREANPDVQLGLVQAARKFWNSVDNKTAPPPEFPQDAEFISKLFSSADGDKVIVADDDVDELAQEYTDLSAAMKQLQDLRDAVKAKILMAIGDAAKVKGDGFSISASVVAGNTVESYFRKDYRLFKVNRSKKK